MQQAEYDLFKKIEAMVNKSHASVLAKVKEEIRKRDEAIKQTARSEITRTTFYR